MKLRITNSSCQVTDLAHNPHETQSRAMGGRWRDMVRNNFSIGDLEKVALNMVGLVKANKGGEYRNKLLNERVQNHHSTKVFCEKIEAGIRKNISDNHGNITFLHNPDRHRTSFEEGRYGRPQFQSGGDIIQGLTIIMKDTWAYDVHILDYDATDALSYTDANYTLRYKVSLYDHFGLDIPDLEKFYYLFDGFRAWFVLQHLKGYQPLLTIVEFENKITGKYKQP